MVREKLSEALKDALSKGDKKRAATLRLICTAIMDREASAREQGRDGILEEEVLDLLRTMLDQRDLECQNCEETLAAQEREEMKMIREFMPAQLNDYEMRLVCSNVVESVQAKGLRDMGRCMNELKQRYPGQMDFAKASCVVKDLLQSASL
ncbi:GatB/YqeY domain-containing protein [Flexibacterium corallicola]|uniref:GatB/YqeY domain-containing protein n=1 Tax=Flexibacterium corallicola TaxID=3037259 RepID=UPI00286EBEEB|nr:GatB/YqeY domain-containing protein [Pseudovibrio sp. M1P-2-3]